MKNLTAFIWLNSTGAWIEIDNGDPVALFQHAHDFVNRIKLADEYNNTEKWYQGLNELKGVYLNLQ
jgi:hypothetical protein